MIDKTYSQEVPPACPNAEMCGGCTYQGVEYPEQLSIKNDEVLKHLAANAIIPGEYKPTINTSDITGYRNKMEYSFGDEVKDGPMTLGLHRKKSYMSVLNVDGCVIVPEDFNIIRAETLKYMESLEYSFYHKRSHKGFLRNLVVRRGEHTEELLINLVTTDEEVLDEESFVKFILDLPLVGNVVGIIHTINCKKSDTISRDSMKILHGRGHYYEELLGLKFRVDAFAFFQTNTTAVENMLLDAFELIKENEYCKTLYDVYCGTGTITLALADSAEKVVGIEIIEDSVEAAKENAVINGIENCEFICGDALEILEQLENSNSIPDMIVVDPPRMGIHPKALKKIISYNLPQILYISCNPKTFCENMAVLQDAGYKLDTLRVFDNFPFTKHIELCSIIIKN